MIHAPEPAGRRRAVARHPRCGLSTVALLLAACESSVPRCPGHALGTAHFLAAPVDGGSTCPFAESGVAANAFTATLSELPGGGVALCVQKPLAVPRTGTRSGNDIAICARTGPTITPACADPVEITEIVTGSLTLDADGELSRFDGALDVWYGAPGSAPEGACGPPTGVPGGGACPLPCEIRYTLETQ